MMKIQDEICKEFDDNIRKNLFKCSKCGTIHATDDNFVLQCKKCRVLNGFGMYIHKM